MLTATFLDANSHYTDTFIASARPETADETGICGTDKSVPYSYRIEFRQNRYICQQCSAYGADIMYGETLRFPPAFRTGQPEIHVSAGAANRH